MSASSDTTPVKRSALTNPRVTVPAVIAIAAVIALMLRPAGKPEGKESRPVAVSAPTGVAANLAAGTVTLEALLAMTPDALLSAIPDPTANNSKPTLAAQEIVRWRGAARKEPETVTHWTNLGDALMQRARERMDPHFYDYAEAAYTIALNKDKQSSEALIGLAWASGGRHQFDRSIEYAKQAIAVNPNNPAPFGLIGDAQVEQGDYDGAFDSYQKMIDIRPDASSYSRGAHLLYLTGDTRKAMALMTMAIKAGGPYTENGAWCRAQLAEMLWNSGLVGPAEVAAKEALKADPDNYFALVAMARVLEAKRDLPGAIKTYQKAVAVSPQHEALVGLGDLYLIQGKTAEAEELFKQVETTHAHHQQHGNHDEYYMARFYADHDRQLDKALKIVQSREPRSPVDRDTAAWVYFKNKHQADAKKWIESALEKGQPPAVRLFHAGMIFAAEGDRVRAQKILYKALSRNPHFSTRDARTAADTLRELGSRPPAGQTAQNSRKTISLR